METIKRAILVAFIYKRAITRTPHIWKPNNNGWKLSDGKYTIKWYSCAQLLEKICKRIADDNLEEVEDIPVPYGYASDESGSDTDY